MLQSNYGNSTGVIEMKPLLSYAGTQCRAAARHCWRQRGRHGCLCASATAPPPPSASPPPPALPLTYTPLLPTHLPRQPLTCWDRPLIYLERALERKGEDEWHFNVLLRCLVTSSIDHSAAALSPTPSLSRRPSRCPGGEVWLSGRE